MSMPPKWPAPRHLRLGLPAFGWSLLVVDAEHPVCELGQLLQVRIQRRRVEQNGSLPGGLPLVDTPSKYD